MLRNRELMKRMEDFGSRGGKVFSLTLPSFEERDEIPRILRNNGRPVSLDENSLCKIDKLIYKDIPMTDKRKQYWVAGLELVNLKNIRHTEIDFRRPDGEPYQIVCITGEAGEGKTILAQALGLSIASAGALIKAVENPHDWCFDGKNPASVRASVQNGAGNLFEVGFDIPLGVDEFELGKSWKKRAKKLLEMRRKDPFFLLPFGYGEFRDSRGKKVLKVKADQNFIQFDAIGTLVDHDRCLPTIDAMIRTLYNNYREYYENLETRVRHLTKGGMLLEGLDESLNFLFQTRNGTFGPDKLSAGHRMLLELLLNIQYQQMLLGIDPDRTIDQRHLLIIDYFESHLAPDLQLNLLKGLYDFFPNCQFFLTTNSTFVVEQMKKHDLDGLLLQAGRRKDGTLQIDRVDPSKWKKGFKRTSGR
ncbi:MAG: hypothetical protein QNK37_02090 [Acidobacteriota bacterium]|nr:hypothetical protein [Acidobacteriota bacterium]